MTKCFPALAGCLWLPITLLLTGLAESSESSELTYEQHVRPILKSHCFHCHGEAGEREGELDLRLRRLIVEGGDSGPAVVPHDPESSPLLDRIEAGEMPPGDDKQLSESEVEVIRQWVAAGAPTARLEPDEIGDGPLFTEEELGHWSFQPIRRPAPPVVDPPPATRVTPIDDFVLDRLRKLVASQGREDSTSESTQVPDTRNEGDAGESGGEAPGRASREPLIELAPEADRYTRLRRASFDLLGLPPTPEEIAQYVEDVEPNAYERMLERLLASPHYGERWGRHWLDVAGYADSEGVTDDDPVRDETFHYRDYVIRSFNADKPFDQFLREQLAGDEMVPLPHTNLSPDAIDKLTATGFLRMAPDGTASSAVEQEVARNQVVADTLHIVSSAVLGLTVSCAECHDHRYDPIPQEDYYRLRAIFEPALDWKNWKVPRARRLSLYTDAQRATASEIEAAAAEVDRERRQKVEEFIARTLEEQLELLTELNDDERAALRTAYQTGRRERTEEQQQWLKRYPVIASISAGSLYLYDGRRSERVRRLEADWKEKQQQLVQAANDRRAADEESAAGGEAPITVETLAQFDPEGAAELERDRQRIDELRAFRAADQLKQYADRASEIRARKPLEPFIRVLTETPGHFPVTYRFFRGDYQQPKEEVPPGELQILARANSSIQSEFPADDPQLPTSGRRLAFARQVTHRDHPLTARVIANRIWMHHMGRGLVNTPSDFGVLGDPPTHPELLDWLATELMENGWSVKHLHRVIMRSAVYRQQSQRRAELDGLDPDNRFYGRMSLRRLEGEVLRDAMLAAVGQLNTRLFGEPVPVMEDDVGQIVVGKENLDGERKPVAGDDLRGEDRRRSVYVQVRRSRPLAVLETFDAPIMDPNCVRRDASTVPLQSLMLMNNAFVIQQGEWLAERIRSKASGDLTRQIELAWQLVLNRPVREDQREGAERFLEQQTIAFQQQIPDATEDTCRRHAMASFCQALFSSNEFLYVD